MAKYSIAYIDRLLWVPSAEVMNMKLLLSYLTVIPRPFADNVDEKPEPIYLYEVKDGFIGVARNFGLERVPRDIIVDKTSLGDSVDSESYKFVGELNGFQEKAVNWVIDEMNRNYGAILSAPTGSGKTVMAINIITRFKLKTLVVVHKSFLKEQWIQAFEKFAPEIKVGEWQQDRNDVDSCDVIIALIQTIISRFGEVSPHAFGMVVFDEVHHVGAPVFSRVAKMFTARYRLGLSATPYRKDGADLVFKWHIGKIIEFPSLEVLRPAIKRIVFKDSFVPTTGFSKYEESFDYALKFIVKNTRRNELIANTAADAVDAGRQVLILTHRRHHVKLLHRLIVEVAKKRGKYYQIGIAVGGMKESIDKLYDKNIIIGTYQFISEGFDVKSLDTLIMATPIADPLQAVGRILRVYPKKNPPIVVDIIDPNIPVALQFYRKRYRIYSEKGWLDDVENVKKYNAEILSKFLNS